MASLGHSELNLSILMFVWEMNEVVIKFDMLLGIHPTLSLAKRLGHVTEVKDVSGVKDKMCPWPFTVWWTSILHFCQESGGHCMGCDSFQLCILTLRVPHHIVFHCIDFKYGFLTLTLTAFHKVTWDTSTDVLWWTQGCKKSLIS